MSPLTMPLATLSLVLLVLCVVLLRSKPRVLLLVLAIFAVPVALGAKAAALILATVLIAVLTSQPLYVLLGAITVLCFEYLGDAPPIDYGIFPEKIFELTDKNVLLAIPFFVVSGALMTHGGIAQRLVNVARALTTWLPGGLPISGVGACILFAAISGSSPVTVIAIGGMLYPTLAKDSFGERDAIGLLTSAGSLGIVIPPSIPMIVYAIVVSGRQVVDVGDLFMAGVGPGLLIGSLLALYVITRALLTSPNRRADSVRMLKGLAVLALPIGLSQLIALVSPWGHVVGVAALLLIALRLAFAEVVDGFWALMLPTLILGGIYSGVFTPTEAAAVAVVYSLVVAIYVYHELTWSSIPAILADSAIMLGSLIVIMVIAFVFNDFIVEAQIPERAVALISQMQLPRAVFLLALNVFLLVVGCFMDIISAILIIAPLVVPMAMAPGLDIDPIHLGIVFIVNLELGYLTPPMGLNLFVASTLFKKPLGFIARAVLPYGLVMLVGIAFITYIPAIALAPGQIIAKLKNDTPPAQDSEAKTPATPTPAQTPNKVLSIEELMRQAAEQNQDPNN